MIKKIFNWSFGAFFRTIGRILAYLAIGILILIIGSLLGSKLPKNIFMKLSASTVPIDNYAAIPNGIYYDCTSSGCNSINTVSDVYFSSNNEYYAQINSSPVTIAKNGVAFTYTPYETLKSGYLYNITTYFCSNKDLSSTSKNQFLGSATSSVSNNYSTTSSSSMNVVGTFNYCYEIQSLISPKSNSSQITYKLTNNTSISDVYLYSIGFKIKELGIYTTEIESIIKSAINSNGLVTSSQLEDATTKVEDTIDENLNNCHDSVNLFNDQELTAFNSSLNYFSNGFVVSATSSWGYAEYSKYFEPGTYTLSGSISGNTAVDFVEIYKNDNWLVGAKLNNSSYTLTLNERTKLSFRFYATTGVVSNATTTFFKIQFQKGSNATAYEDFGQKYCTNKIDSVNDSINDLNDSINDTSSPDTESAISSWADKMIDNPLADVLLLPLTVLNSIQSALQGTCSSLELTVPFIDYDVSIPCISTIFAQIDGLIPLWNSIGTIVSAIMLYQYLIYLYNWIDDTISLKTKRMQGWGSV